MPVPFIHCCVVCGRASRTPSCIPVRLMSCCSFSRFCAVCCMPAPMPLARLRNSELCWMFACVWAAPGIGGAMPASMYLLRSGKGTLTMVGMPDLTAHQGCPESKMLMDCRGAFRGEHSQPLLDADTDVEAPCMAHSPSYLAQICTNREVLEAALKMIAYLTASQPLDCSQKICCAISTARIRERRHCVSAALGVQ